MNGKIIFSSERGVSVVVEMMLILMILTTTFPVFYLSYTYTMGRQKEEELIRNVESAFLELKMRVEDLRENEYTTVEMKMEAELVPFSINPKTGSEISIDPIQPYGHIKLDMFTHYATGRAYVYELGGVLLVQDNQNIMLSPPLLITAVDAGEDTIGVRVSWTRITGIGRHVSGTGTVEVTASCKQVRWVVDPPAEPNRAEVTIVVESQHEQAWSDYLKNLEVELNKKGYNAEANGLQLTILGKGSGNDIYYSEENIDIELILG